MEEIVMNKNRASKLLCALLLVAVMLFNSVIPAFADDSTAATVPSEMLATVDGTEYVVFDFGADTAATESVVGKYKVYNGGGYNAVYDSEKAAWRLIPGQYDTNLFNTAAKNDEFGNPVYVTKLSGTNVVYRDFGLNLRGGIDRDVRIALADKLNTQNYAILTYYNDSAVSAMQYLAAGGTYDVKLRSDANFNSVIIPLTASTNRAVYRHPAIIPSEEASLVAFRPISEDYVLPLKDVKIYYKSLAYAATYEDALKWCQTQKTAGTIANYHNSSDASRVDVGVKAEVTEPEKVGSLSAYYNSKFTVSEADGVWKFTSNSETVNKGANNADFSYTVAGAVGKEVDERRTVMKTLSAAASRSKYMVLTVKNTFGITNGKRINKLNDKNSTENVYYVSENSNDFYSVIIDIYDDANSTSTLLFRNNCLDTETDANNINVFAAFYPISGYTGTDLATGKELISMRKESPLFETHEDAVEYCKYLYSQGLSSGYYDNGENPVPTVPQLDDSKSAEIASKSLELYETEAVLKAGETLDISKYVSVYPKNTTDTVVYTTSNEAAATVENGVIKGVGDGIAEITVTSGSCSATFTVWVGDYPDYYVYDYNSLASGNVLTMCSNMTRTVNSDEGYVRLAITADVSDAKFFYNPSDSIIAELYPVMKMVYRSNVQNFTGNYYTDLSAVISPVKLENRTENRLYSYKPTLTNNGTQTTYLQDLSAKDVFKGSQYGGVWSDNVGSDSLYKQLWFYNWHGVGNKATAGDYFDIAYIGFFKSTADAEAYDLFGTPTSVKLSETAYTMAPGETLTLSADVYPSTLSADNKKVTWTSNSDAVSVDANGLVTAKSVGTAIVTATTEQGNLSDTCFISVLEKPAKALSLKAYSSGTVRTGKIAFLGDSITAGSGVGVANTYFKWFADKYAFNAVGWGLSGSNISGTGSSHQPSFIERVNVIEGGAWADTAYTGSYESALAAKTAAEDSDVIFVLGGINDFGQNAAKFDNFGTGVQNLINSLKEKFPNSQLVFATPLKNSGYFSVTTNKEGKTLSDFVTVIAEKCAENSIPFINSYDLFDEFCTFDASGNVVSTEKNATDYYVDGVHPNVAGHKLMAERFETELTRLGIIKPEIDCVVFGADKIVNNVTTTYMDKSTITDGEKVYARFTSTYSGSITDLTNKDAGVNFKVTYPNGISANDYPVAKIVYRTNHGNKVDLTTGIKSASANKNFKYFGYRAEFATIDGSVGIHTFNMYNTYTNGENVSQKWSDYIPTLSDAKITYQTFKVCSGYNTQITSNSYYDVLYIGFFKTEEDAANYEYTVKNYTVSFTDKDGTVLEGYPIEVKDGATVEAPAAPKVSGLVLTGWLDTATDKLVSDFTKYPIDSDKVFKAYYRNEKGASEYITARGGIGNLNYKLKQGEKITVAYLGGSVTYGHGASNNESTSWRALTGAWLKSKFGENNVTCVNAAIGGSGSALGAYRVDTDVIAKDPDLVFVEYAVNDGYSNATNTSEAAVEKYYELVLRKLRQALPQAEIITVYTTDTGISNGGVSRGEYQDKVAAHYGLTSLWVGRYLTDSMINESSSFAKGNAPWKHYFIDDVHPSDFGYAVYAELIDSYLETALGADAPASLVDYALPGYYSADAAKLDTIVINVTDAAVSYAGFTLDSDNRLFGMSEIKGLLKADASAENIATVNFTGTGVSVFMDFGDRKNYTLAYSLDGAEYVTVTSTDTNHPLYISALHGLENKAHTVSFKFTDITGTVPRIGAFLIDGTTERTVTLKYREGEGTITAVSNDEKTPATLGEAVTDADGNTVQTVTVYKGSKVTFTAEPTADYKMDGWYNESNTKLNGGAVYVVEVDGDVTLNPRFYDISVASSVMLNVAVNNGKVKVNDGEATNYIPADYYSSRDDIKLEAVPNEGYVFAYWFRETNNNVVFVTDTATCYVKPLGNSVTYQPLFIEAGKTETIYVDSAYVKVDENKAPSEVTVPERFGYTADTEKYDNGWKLEIDNDTLKVYVAQYTRVSEAYTLNIEYADTAKTANTSVSVKYNETVTINASSDNFSHWEITYNGETKTISSKKAFVYTHVLLDNATIREVADGTAVFPLVIGLDAYYKNGRAWFAAAFDLPESWDCTLVEHGVLMTSDAETATVDNFNLMNSDKLIVGRIDKIDGSATSVFMVAKSDPKVTWYGRPYLVYKDAKGNVEIVYGDILTYSYQVIG